MYEHAPQRPTTSPSCQSSHPVIVSLHYASHGRRICALMVHSGEEDVTLRFQSCGVAHAFYHT
jgi:hypothetical protein